jgi:hypothetical protein
MANIIRLGFCFSETFGAHPAKRLLCGNHHGFPSLVGKFPKELFPMQFSIIHENSIKAMKIRSKESLFGPRKGLLNRLNKWRAFGKDGKTLYETTTGTDGRGKTFEGQMLWEKQGEIPIAAFRCKKCGYLEFYADEEFAAE